MTNARTQQHNTTFHQFINSSFHPFIISTILSLCVHAYMLTMYTCIQCMHLYYVHAYNAFNDCICVHAYMPQCKHLRCINLKMHTLPDAYNAQLAYMCTCVQACIQCVQICTTFMLTTRSYDYIRVHAYMLTMHASVDAHNV